MRSSVQRVVTFLALFAALAVASGAAAGRESRFDRTGISFEYPADWFVTSKPLSNGSDPDYRFAVATWPIHRTPRDRGPCLAGIARQRPAGGALAFLREYVTNRKRVLRRVPERRHRFRLPTQADDAGCLGKGTFTIHFKEAGRAFVLYISVGPRATPSTRRDLRKILNGLEIRPLRGT